MNEKDLPPALNGDASLEEVFAGLKPSLPPHLWLLLSLFVCYAWHFTYSEEK